MKSFVDKGEKYELYTYDENISTPCGVKVKNASNIYPKKEIFRYENERDKGSIAVFADMFRYKLLFERGGWWVDTDVFYTGQDVPKEDEYFGLQNEDEVNIAIMKLPKKSKIAGECVERVYSMGKETAASSWGKTGPKLFTEVLKERGKMGEAYPRSYAYPLSGVPQNLYLSGCRKEVQEKVSGVPFFHIWNAELRRMGFEKEVGPPEGSYLDQCAEELKIEWPCPKVKYSDESVSQMAENLQKYRAAEWKIEKIRSSNTYKIISYLSNLKNKIGM